MTGRALRAAELRTVAVRNAHRGDARRLASLAEATFRDAFGAANTAEDMDRHCRSAYGEALQAREIDLPGVVTLVAEADDVLVGYVQLRWGPPPPCVAARAAGEIQRLYVARAWHGRGVAQDLVQASLDALAARGSDVVWLGVWEHNPKAIAFYRKSGFREVGEHVFVVGSDPQRDIVMARGVQASPAHGS